MKIFLLHVFKFFQFSHDKQRYILFILKALSEHRLTCYLRLHKTACPGMKLVNTHFIRLNRPTDE